MPPQNNPPVTQPNPGSNNPVGPGVKPINKSNPNSTQNTLQFAEIRDGIVIMNDGSFRAVIACQSINFDLMSPEEREAVEYSYQSFLNSLYFPIQIFVRSQKVDIRPYIEKLDKIRSEHDNMLLAVLMEDYIQFMSSLAEETNIMDKKFYVVIPYFKEVDGKQILEEGKGFLQNFFGKKEQSVVINERDLEEGKGELRNRIQAIMSGLNQCGVQSVPLDTQELIELYYDVYNPDTATRQQINRFEGNLNADIVEKGVGDALNPQLDKELGN